MTPTPKENLDSDSPLDGATAASGVVLILILLVVGSIGWWLYLRPVLEIDPTSIARVESTLGGWTGENIPISEGVERMLRADAHVQRAYRNADDELLWLYVGYYGTRRGGRPEHTPWVCYPSAGWSIVSSSEAELSDSGGSIDDGRYNEIVVELNGERRLVHFWYMTHRTTALASETALTLDHMRGRFSSSGRADGALVRISTPISWDGIDSARERLKAFTRPLVGELREFWPEA